MNNDETIALETLIDNYGLSSVLESIGVICREKAEHIRASYCDGVLSQCWDDAGKRVAKVSSNSIIRSLG